MLFKVIEVLRLENVFKVTSLFYREEKNKAQSVYEAIGHGNDSCPLLGK